MARPQLHRSPEEPRDDPGSHYALYPAMMGFFGAFHSPGVTFMPSVEYTFELYKNLLLGMVLVFQLPTLAFFLAKMRLVTARLRRSSPCR